MPEKILVVDDSIDSRKLISVILKHAGYEITEAGSGEDALALVQQFTPDLILLDIMMPGLDGYSVCTQFKKDARTSDIPVIFLSALADAKDKIKGLETGGVDYVIKPFDRGEALARVRNQLNIQRLRREIVLANKELMEKQRYLDEDPRAAADIQQCLLPKKLPAVENFDIAWKFLPCEHVGGRHL